MLITGLDCQPEEPTHNRVDPGEHGIVSLTCALERSLWMQCRGYFSKFRLEVAGPARKILQFTREGELKRILSRTHQGVFISWQVPT